MIYGLIEKQMMGLNANSAGVTWALSHVFKIRPNRHTDVGNVAFRKKEVLLLSPYNKHEKFETK